MAYVCTLVLPRLGFGALWLGFGSLSASTFAARLSMYGSTTGFGSARLGFWLSHGSVPKRVRSERNLALRWN